MVLILQEKKVNRINRKLNKKFEKENHLTEKLN